jgi:thymidylate synthase (FAD)
VIVVPQTAELVALTAPYVRPGTPFHDQLEAAADPCTGPARLVERCGRVCWKSEGKATRGSAALFIDRVVGQLHHESIAEHASATVLFTTDRIVTHQVIRHRIAAYSQESTHYINYAKRGEELTVCKPLGLEPGTDAYRVWFSCMQECEKAYFALIRDLGVKHYTARYAMPHCLKTELVATYNFRTWLHVLRIRTAPNNTPEIIDLMKQAGRQLAAAVPEVFKEFA